MTHPLFRRTLLCSAVLAATLAHAQTYEMRKPVPKLNVAATPAPAQPVASFDVGSQLLDFGPVVVNQPYALSFAVLNTGELALSNFGATVSGGNTSNFSAQHNCPPTLGIAQSCEVSVTFTPRAQLLYASNVSVGWSGLAARNVSLQGSGFVPPAPALGLSDSALTFSSQPAGSSTSQVLTLSNAGNAALSLTALPTVSGSTAFSRTSTCATSLAAGASCTVTVTYAPVAAGSHTGTLQFGTNAAGYESVSVALSGTAGPALAAVLGLSSGSLTFEPQDEGTTSTQVLTLSNTGTAPLVLSSAPALLGSDAFTKSSTCGASVAVGSSCTVTVTYAPVSAGAHSATLQFATNAPGTESVSVPVSGSAVDVPTPAELVVGSNSLSYSSTIVNNSQVKSVVLYNTGETALTFTQLPTLDAGTSTAYTATSTCDTTLAGGDSCSVTVTFQPTTVGAHTGSVSFDTNVSEPASITLSGTAEAAPVAQGAWSDSYWQVSPPVTTFAQANIGTSQTKRVYLRNTATGGQLAASFALTGATGQFSITAAPVKAQESNTGTTSCDATLSTDKLSTTECLADAKAGSNGYPHIALDIKFSPTAQGTHSVQLTPLSSNGSVLPGALTFTGTGQMVLPTGYFQLNGLVYSKPDGVTRTWSNASSYCTTSTLAGVTGWRMATVTEMENFRYQKAVFDPAGNGWPSTGYAWTSTVSLSGHFGANLASSPTRTSKEGDTYVNMLDSNVRYVSCIKVLNP